MMKMESLNKVILFDIDYTIFNTAYFKKTHLQEYELYDEVYGALSRLAGIAILGIFSEGEKAFQTNKLKATKVDHFFGKEHVLIDPQKQKRIKKIRKTYKSKRLYVVDDKLLMLSSVKKEIPRAKTIWLKRGVYAENQRPLADFTPDAAINNLTELIPLIDKL